MKLLHNYIKNDESGDHWSVGVGSGNVLVQLQKEGEQVRLNLKPEQAKEMAQSLLNYAEISENKKEENKVLDRTIPVTYDEANKINLNHWRVKDRFITYRSENSRIIVEVQSVIQTKPNFDLEFDYEKCRIDFILSLHGFKQYLSPADCRALSSFFKNDN